MKRFKIMLTALLLAGVIVVVFAFTNKNAHRTPVTPSTMYSMYYDADGFQTRGQIDPGNTVLVQSEVQDLNNWTTVFQVGCSTGAYLCGITFAQESSGLEVSDGIADGECSRQEAVNALWSEYVKGNTPSI